MVVQSPNSFYRAALSVSVAFSGVMLQFPQISNAAPQTVEPRSCQSLLIMVQPQQTLSDPDWTSEGQVKQRWQPASSAQPNEPKPIEQWVTSVAFSPDGRTLASSSRYKESVSKQGPVLIGVPSGNQGLNGRLEVWQNLETSEWNRKILYTSKREINAIAFSPAGAPLLAAGGNDKGFVGLWGQKQWNTPQSKPQDQANNQFQVNTIAFSPDGRMLASGGIRGRGGKGSAIQRWDVRQGKLVSIKGSLQNVSDSRLSKLLEDQEVYTIAFSPDSKIIAAGGLSTFFDRQGTVYKRLKAESFLHLWDAKTGKYLCSINQPPESLAISAVAFSPDGTMVAIGDTNGSIRLWSLTRAELITTFKHRDRVNAIAFSPSGKILLSGSADKTATLWKIPTGELIRSFDHPDEVTSVTFRPDGQALATGNRDSRVQLIWASSGE